MNIKADRAVRLTDRAIKEELDQLKTTELFSEYENLERDCEEIIEKATKRGEWRVVMVVPDRFKRVLNWELIMSGYKIECERNRNNSWFFTIQW